MLAKAICKSEKLKKLNLANNELKNETAQILSLGLRENNCLRHLNLDGNIMKLEYLELVQSYTRGNLTRTSKAQVPLLRLFKNALEKTLNEDGLLITTKLQEAS